MKTVGASSDVGGAAKRRRTLHIVHYHDIVMS